MLIKVLVISETRNDSLAPVIIGFACTNRTHLIIQVVSSVRYNFTFILYPPSRYLNFIKQSKKVLTSNNALSSVN